MIASLPMYWRPENAGAWRRLWTSVQASAAREGLALPELTPPDALPQQWQTHWQSPNLVLSQTCGLPFRTELRDRVQYVATFDFGLNCRPGYYLSCGIMSVRPAPDTPNILAYNEATSQSGWAAVPAPEQYDGLRETGSHEASARAVAEHRAKAAYVDAVTWRLLQRATDLGDRLRLFECTPPTPGLPLITALGQDPAPLRAALRQAVLALADADREALGGLRGVSVLEPSEYYAIPTPAPPADTA